MFDDGWHKLATAIWLFGPIKEVRAWVGGTEVYPGITVDAPTMIAWQHENGIRGVWDITLAPDMYLRSDYYTNDERWEITGRSGYARVNRCTGRGIQQPSLEVYLDGEMRSYHALDDDWGSSFRDSGRHWLRWLHTGEGPMLWSAEEAMDVLRFALAVYASSEAGGTGWTRPRSGSGTGPAARAPAGRRGPRTGTVLGVVRKEPAASLGRRIGALGLTVVLLVGTLVVGFVVWSVFEWRHGRTPSYRLLGLHVVDAPTGSRSASGVRSSAVASAARCSSCRPSSSVPSSCSVSPSGPPHPTGSSAGRAPPPGTASPPRRCWTAVRPSVRPGAEFRPIEPVDLAGVPVAELPRSNGHTLN